MRKAEMCYVLLPTQDYSVGVVKWGECGYYPTNYPTGYTQEAVDKMNERLGVEKLVVEAMVICSMNRFSSAEEWEKHFDMVYETMVKNNDSHRDFY